MQLPEPPPLMDSFRIGDSHPLPTYIHINLWKSNMAIENHLCSSGIFPSLPPVIFLRQDGPKNVKGDIQRAVSYRFLAQNLGGR